MNKVSVRVRKPLVEVIDSKYWNASQSCFVTIIYKESGFKFKMEIRVNTFDFQSYCRVSVWKIQDMAWSFIYSIPFKQMTSINFEKVYAYKKAEEQKDKFKADLFELQKKAREIVIQL